MFTIDNVELPKRATIGSAGYDIYLPEDTRTCPGYVTEIDTGIKFDGKEIPVLVGERLVNKGKQVVTVGIVPRSWVALIIPRSSYGFKYGLEFKNTVCVIDKDYRDTIKLAITTEIGVEFKKGDRIGQIIFIPHCVLADEIIPTESRTGGIGSTGR